MNHLVIEVTNKCNLKCKMCGVVGRRYYDTLPLEDIKNIINQACTIKGVKRISFHGLGEPLLHPAIADAVLYAKSKGFYTGFATNGFFLDETKARQLLDANIDFIIVSLNGISNDAYKEFQGYGYNDVDSQRILEKVIENIKNFLKVRDEKRKKTEVRLSYILTADSKKYLKEYLSYWKKTGYKVMIVVNQLSTWKYDEKTRYTRCEHIDKDFMVLANGMITWCGCNQLIDGGGI